MKALLISFILAFPFFVFSNGNESDGFGNINGLVTTSDGQPAAYVSVQVENSGKGTVTDKRGNFEIKKIKPGKYTLIVSLLNYTQRDTTIEIKENDTLPLKIFTSADPGGINRSDCTCKPGSKIRGIKNIRNIAPKPSTK
jgi:hypothetical protein